MVNKVFENLFVLSLKLKVVDGKQFSNDKVFKLCLG